MQLLYILKVEYVQYNCYKQFLDTHAQASGTTYCEVVRYHPGSATSGVGPAIVHHASDTEADVIIVGSRGLGAVER